MKRILACVLALCTVLSLLALPVHAAPQDADPVVFTLGFSTVDLYYWDGVSDTRERVWNLSADGVLDLAKANLPQALWGLFKAVVFRRYDTLNDAAGKIAAPVLEKMEKLTMLPDGTQKYDLSVSRAVDPDVPLSYGKEYRNVYLSGIYRALRAEYGRVYVFVSDWRLGQVRQARDLDAYIQKVKADSGRDQVSLFGFSQGGETIATYLYYYGDKGDVKRAVMETPAIGGTEFASCILDGDNFNIHTDTMIAFCEAYMETELHYELLARFLPLNWLKDSILSIAYTHVLPITQYWGGLWDLVPAAEYDRLKTRYLDPAASAKLIAESDAYHYDVIPHLGEKLRALQAGGLPISIVCNTGNPLLFCDVEGDGVLSAANVSGAAVAPYGKRLTACAHTACADKTHDHLSPSGTVDASCCYLPENTWFVDGQFHGQCDWDEYTYTLLCKLMLTDELPDVYADPAFPQFAFAQSPADALTIRFDKTGSYTGAGSVTVTNLSASHPVRLCSVRIRGTKLSVDLPRGTVLQPGEAVTLTVSGVLPQDGANTPVCVRYVRTDDKVPLLREKTFRTSARTW